MVIINDITFVNVSPGRKKFPWKSNLKFFENRKSQKSQISDFRFLRLTIFEIFQIKIFSFLLIFAKKKLSSKHIFSELIVFKL